MTAPCLHCERRPRWRAGLWCSKCITKVCCRPMLLRRLRCAHGDSLQRKVKL